MGKTKKIIFDFKKVKTDVVPIILKNESVEIVDKYKYLCVYIDNRLNFSDNIGNLYKRSTIRLQHLRNLNKFLVNKNILNIFYMSIIQSVLDFCISTWYGSARVEDLKKLWKIIKWSGWNGVTKAKHLEELYKDSMLSISNKICDNADHPLNTFYKVLPSGRRYPAVRPGRVD